jgi:hypothetical protein
MMTGTNWYVRLLLKYYDLCHPCKVCIVQATCKYGCDKSQGFVNQYIEWAKDAAQKTNEQLKEIAIELMYNISKRLLEEKKWSNLKSFKS